MSQTHPAIPIPTLECVPNFSEGRDRSIVESIAEAIGETPDVVLCGWEMDSDHNRSVITFAGPPEATVEAAVRGAAVAASKIDLSRHDGIHPRVGVTDVVPFIPFQGTSMRVAIAAAERAAKQLWELHGIPVYLYGEAAHQPGRARLEKVRRNGFDGLAPDFGTLASHPTAGASVVGARDFLIAYNVDLTTTDIQLAQAIARKIRESSGGFPYVKAMGLYLATRNCAQVTMNLTKFSAIPLEDLYSTIQVAAQQAGADIAASELIGFIPQAAYDAAPNFFRRTMDFHESRILEHKIAMLSAGLHA